MNPLVSTNVASVGCSLLASIIYDAFKEFSKKHLYGASVSKEEIEEKVIDKLKPDFENLYMSGEFQVFIQSPVFHDIIKAYIQYKITGNIANEIKKIKNSSISEDEIIALICDRLLDLYDESAICKPNRFQLERFFKAYSDLAYEVWTSNMSPENKGIIFFIDDRIDRYFENISFQISSLNNSLIQLQNINKNYSDVSHYKDIVDVYHKKLNKNRSKAHIYLLDDFDFSKFYVPPKLAHVYNKDDEEMSIPVDEFYDLDYGFDDWKHIFDLNNIVYVTGGAGYGKSLFLNKLINDYSQLNINSIEEYLVIYGDLKALSIESEKSPSVIDYLQDCMVNETMMRRDKITKDLIEYYLKTGRCLILLDALDEVEKEKRSDLHHKIISYFQTENPSNKICITSRDRGFIPAEDIDLYRICALDKKHIECYLDNIIALGKFDKKNREKFLKQSEILVQKKFLSSFLILSLLINIYKGEKELPENKIELYEKCFSYIAIKREKEKVKIKYDWNLLSGMLKESTFIELARMCFPNNNDVDKNEIIETLCTTYKMKYSNEVQTERAAEHFLKYCADRTELFVPSSREDRFKFFHRSFFEYFYAQYIFYRILQIDEKYKLLSSFDVDSEVQELTVALMKQKNEFAYQELVNYLFERLEMKKSKVADRLVALNIFMQIFPVMDDVVYRDRFINYLLNNKEFIFRKTSNIQNQQLMIYEIANDKNSIKKIATEYYDISKVSIINIIVRAYNLIPYYDSSRYIYKEAMLKKYVINRIQNAIEANFYVYAFCMCNDISLIINNMTIEEFESLLAKVKMNKRDYNKSMKLFEAFYHQSDESKKRFENTVLKKLEFNKIL